MVDKIIYQRLLNNDGENFIRTKERILYQNKNYEVDRKATELYYI